MGTDLQSNLKTQHLQRSHFRQLVARTRLQTKNETILSFVGGFCRTRCNKTSSNINRHEGCQIYDTSSNNAFRDT